jgi:hypothetical protein
MTLLRGVVWCAAMIAAFTPLGGVDAQRTSRWWMLAGGPWESDMPYYNASFVQSSVALAAANRASMTGVYLFLPLSVQAASGGNSVSDAVVVVDDAVMATVVPPFLRLGLSVSGSIWVDPAVMRSGAALEAIPNLTAAAVRHNLSALFVDFEGQNDPVQATALARFVGALAAALHAVGRAAEMAVDAGGILNQYALYAATGADRLMTMATYNGWGADGDAGFSRLTGDVDAELHANVSRAQLAVAVGSMIVGERPDGTGTPCPDAWGNNLNYQWTPTGLARFVSWLEQSGVRHLDVYRCDLCLLNSTTEQWLWDATAQWLSRGGHGRGQPESHTKHLLRS